MASPTNPTRESSAGAGASILPPPQMAHADAPAPGQPVYTMSDMERRLSQLPRKPRDVKDMHDQDFASGAQNIPAGIPRVDRDGNELSYFMLTMDDFDRHPLRDYLVPVTPASIFDKEGRPLPGHLFNKFGQYIGNGPMILFFCTKAVSKEYKRRAVHTVHDARAEGFHGKPSEGKLKPHMFGPPGEEVPIMAGVEPLGK